MSEPNPAAPEEDWDHPDPEALYRQLLADDPTSPLPHFSLARLLVASQRHLEAVPHLRFCLERQPDWAVAWLLLGDALDGSSDRPGARAAWERGRDLGAAQHHDSLVEEAEEKLAG